MSQRQAILWPLCWGLGNIDASMIPEVCNANATLCYHSEMVCSIIENIFRLHSNAQVYCVGRNYENPRDSRQFNKYNFMLRCNCSTVSVSILYSIPPSISKSSLIWVNDQNFTFNIIDSFSWWRHKSQQDSLSLILSLFLSLEALIVVGAQISQPTDISVFKTRLV